MNTIMTTKLVNVRIPKELFNQAEFLIQREGYASMQELLKESLRAHVSEKLKKVALLELKRLAGSYKHIKPLSKEEMDKLVRKEFFNMK